MLSNTQNILVSTTLSNSQNTLVTTWQPFSRTLQPLSKTFLNKLNICIQSLSCSPLMALKWMLSVVPHNPTILWTRAKMKMEKGNAHKSTIISWFHLNNHICARIRTDGYGCLESVGFQADCYNSSPDLRACAALMLVKPVALLKPISVSLLHSCPCEYVVSLLFQTVAPHAALSSVWITTALSLLWVTRISSHSTPQPYI